MKMELIPALLCPLCEEGSITPLRTRENGIEVREGVLECGECGRAYALRGGMADFLADPSHEVTREREAWESMRPPAADGEDDRARSRAWLLALPMLEGKEGPRREIETWRRHGRAVFDLLAGEEWRERRVLELGAGRCWLSAHLARLGARVVAADILDDEDIGLGCADVFMAESAFFERVLCDMHHLPFKAGSFNAVVATATLQHSPGMPDLLGEIARVLVPGGIVVAANEPLYVPWREKPEEERKGAHESAYTLWGWLRYLRRSGFRVEVVRVGSDASLHIVASPAAGSKALPRGDLLAAAARYAEILALAPPRLMLRTVRAMKAGRPMRPAPRDRMAYLASRMGLRGIRERALAEEEANWGPGWYGSEGDDEYFRWSGPRARLLLPAAGGARDLELELATFRPSPQADPVEVEVRVGGEKAGEILLERHGWRRFRLPAPHVERRRPVPVTLRVKRGYFVPSELGLGEDRRVLGVACRGAWWVERGETGRA